MERDLKKLIREMTLEEKAGLCSGYDTWNLKGIPRLGIPTVMVSDGPHGLRKQDENGDHMGVGQSISAVCFPAACATASSFDPELLERLGSALGEECQAENISVLLGPAVNIKRNPLCGRNFEYFSEDPYLAGHLAEGYIKGVQSWDVGTCIKHFAVNNQEHCRMSCSSNLTERTLREIYLPAFEHAIRAANPKSVMCSYNKINGVYASENRKLLTKILREEWGFGGAVITDWGAVGDRVVGLQAGLDLEMPGSGGVNDRRIIDAVRSGTLDEAVLDTAVERILQLIFDFAEHRHREAVFDRHRDHMLTADLETECAVLLENNGVLPLHANMRIAYIGEFAEKPRYQGSGSSRINAGRVTSALEIAQAKGRNITYAKGFYADSDEANEELLQAAVQVAEMADAAVVFAGLPESFESEGYDRQSMKMPAVQDRLIADIAAVQPNTIVVLHNGSPVETPWATKVSAILEMYLGGQGVGIATDRLLFGEANPCGKLAETFPLRLEDNPSYLTFPGDGKNVEYTEGIYVGYRYYEAKKLPVRWAFGHGRSYTEFSYRNLKLSAETLNDDSAITITADITNIGSMAGKEAVQLYVADRNDSFGRPIKELKGFQKLALQPGETKTATFTLEAGALCYYDEVLGDWYAPSGKYEILIGSASDDIRLYGEVSFRTTKALPFPVELSTTIRELLNHPVTVREGRKLFRTVENGMGIRPLHFTDGEESSEILDETDDMTLMILGLPIKSITSFAGESLCEKPAEIVSRLNLMLGNHAG